MASEPATLFYDMSVRLLPNAEVLAAAEMLEHDHGVAADVWSVTSFNELARDGQDTDRWNMLHPEEEDRLSYVERQLASTTGPVIAASDYMTLVQDQISRWVPRRYVALGTDGYGMSDTREALRRHFEVDAQCIVIGALDALRQEGAITPKALADAIESLGVDPDKPNSAHT